MLGKHSGKHAFAERLKTMGYSMSDEQISFTFEKFKELADRKKEVTDADLLALTPISAFRPRRWRGALLPHRARTRFEILEPDKRPVSAVADNFEVRDVISVDVAEDQVPSEPGVETEGALEVQPGAGAHRAQSGARERLAG